MLETCLELRRGLGNQVDVAATLSTLSLARLQAGDFIAAGVGEHEALDIFRRLGDRIGEAIGLLHLGQVSAYAGDDQDARAHLEQCLALAQDIEHQEVVGECELVLGQLDFDAGELDRAEQRLARSFSVCSDAADKRGRANALGWLGRLDLRRGKLAAARSRLGEALRDFRQFEMWDELLGCLEDHALLLWREGHTDDAIRIAAVAGAARSRLRLSRAPRLEQAWQAQLAALREGAEPAAFAAAWSEGEGNWEVDDAVRASLAGRPTGQPAGELSLASGGGAR